MWCSWRGIVFYVILSRVEPAGRHTVSGSRTLCHPERSASEVEPVGRHSVSGSRYPYITLAPEALIKPGLDPCAAGGLVLLQNLGAKLRQAQDDIKKGAFSYPFPLGEGM